MHFGFIDVRKSLEASQTYLLPSRSKVGVGRPSVSGPVFLCPLTLRSPRWAGCPPLPVPGRYPGLPHGPGRDGLRGKPQPCVHGRWVAAPLVAMTSFRDTAVSAGCSEKDSWQLSGAIFPKLETLAGCLPQAEGLLTLLTGRGTLGPHLSPGD